MKTDVSGMFTSKDVTSSVVFIVDGRELHVSKEVLALMSPVFRSMFESDFKERTAEYIPLPGKSYASMVEFLLCIYPNTQKPVSDDNVYALLGLAEEYQVDLLKKKCEEYLYNRCKNGSLPLSELVLILLTAEVYTIKRLYDVSFELVSKYKPEDVVEIPEYKQLSSSTRSKMAFDRYEVLGKLKLSDDNVHKVLQTAADYNENELLQKCEDHLVSRCKKSEKPLVHGLVTMLCAADKHNLTKLREECIKLASKRKSHDLEDSPIFKRVTHETILRIFSKRIKVFEGLYGKLTKLRCHCCKKHSDYNCKICFIAVTKEFFTEAGMTF